MTLKARSEWLTRQIIRVAMRVAPRARVDWAIAMTREIDAIAGQRDALRWALGCLKASCHERLKSMRPTDLWPVRWGMALWMALLAVETLGSAGITLAYKFGLHPLSAHPNEQLLKVTPLWEPMATLAIGLTFVLAMVLILKRSRAALEAVAIPFVLMLGLVAIRFGRPESGDLQSLAIAYERSPAVLVWPVAGLVLTMLMCWALWHDRQPVANR